MAAGFDPLFYTSDGRLNLLPDKHHVFFQWQERMMVRRFPLAGRTIC
jgi:hypothetical protein